MVHIFLALADGLVANHRCKSGFQDELGPNRALDLGFDGLKSQLLIAEREPVFVAVGHKSCLVFGRQLFGFEFEILHD